MRALILNGILWLSVPWCNHIQYLKGFPFLNLLLFKNLRAVALGSAGCTPSGSGSGQSHPSAAV